MNKQLMTRIVMFFLLAPAVFTAHSEYSPSKVVYDVPTADPDVFNHILDRASLLQDIYGNDPFDASIVIVIHEAAIPLFARGESGRSQIMKRARSLTATEIIQFRLCRASARMQGFDPTDFYEFVTLVPMADAEIVQLQIQGYAYLR